MANGFEESKSRPLQSPSTSSNHNNTEAGNFECNICLDLAQDPIITLCGHLYCWPCLYKWLHFHSQSQECPVCKAFILEERLVPLYGRGKTSNDLRSKSIPDENIPHRPAGQRPETAPRRGPGLRFVGGMRGFVPIIGPRFGNLTFSAVLFGLLPTIFNFQLQWFPDGTMYGGAAGFPYGLSNVFHGGHFRGLLPHLVQGQQDYYLKRLLLFIIFCVVVALIWQLIR